MGTRSINEGRELERGRRKEVRAYLSTIGKRSIDSPSCIMNTPLPSVFAPQTLQKKPSLTPLTGSLVQSYLVIIS